MKISAIKSYPVWVGTRNQMLVKVETDEGVFGWGESGLSGREKAVAGAIDHYAQWLIGRDPLATGALWQEMYRSQYFEGGRVLQAAISALDIAFHDIKGKALGVPVYQLLGGKQRDRIPTFASTSAQPGEEMIDQARKMMDGGWTVVRFFPHDQGSTSLFEPRATIGQTALWMVKAREALGDSVVLGVDYHHRLSVGEEFASKWQFLPYIERGIHQFNRIDVCNGGGLTEAMKGAGWSEAHYVDMMPHNPLGPVCTAATVHFGAAVQ